MIARLLRSAPLPLMLLASACVAPPASPPPPPPHVPAPAAPPPVPPPPPQTTDWRDIPLTRGDWRYGPEASGSAARFGVADAGPEFIVRCDRAARTVTLSRAANATGPATMAITTSAGDRALNVVPVAGPPPALAATLPAGDGFLDRMAFSRGRFVVAVTGTARLVIPSWPEFARVLEDCRG